MEVIRTVVELRALLDQARANGKRVGLVGTSGAMHEGHLSLVERAAAENEVMALFWGGTPPDLDWRKPKLTYERDPDRDFPLAEAAGCNILFAPPGSELHRRPPMTRVTLPAMSSELPQLEDPAHLDLIALTMCKLWNIFGACRVYFGEKDWQQLAMFKRLAQDLWYPVEVIGGPTIREDDGLPVSSRNAQMTLYERAVAPVIYQALRACEDAVRAGAAHRANQLEKVFTETISELTRINYFAAVEADTMKPLDELSGSVRLLASIQLGSVRILDNIGVEVDA